MSAKEASPTMSLEMMALNWSKKELLKMGSRIPQQMIFISFENPFDSTIFEERSLCD